MTSQKRWYLSWVLKAKKSLIRRHRWEKDTPGNGSSIYYGAEIWVILVLSGSYSSRNWEWLGHKEDMNQRPLHIGEDLQMEYFHFLFVLLPPSHSLLLSVSHTLTYPFCLLTFYSSFIFKPEILLSRLLSLTLQYTLGTFIVCSPKTIFLSFRMVFLICIYIFINVIIWLMSVSCTTSMALTPPIRRHTLSTIYTHI